MRDDPAPYDSDALALILDSSEWLTAFVNQAIERRAVDPQQVIELQASAETHDVKVLSIVRQALENGYPANGLPPSVQAMYSVLLGIRDRVPSAASRVAAARLIDAGGSVGYDVQDRLVWSLPGGAADAVLDAEGRPDGTAH